MDIYFHFVTGLLFILILLASSRTLRNVVAPTALEVSYSYKPLQALFPIWAKAIIVDKRWNEIKVSSRYIRIRNRLDSVDTMMWFFNGSVERALYQALRGMSYDADRFQMIHEKKPPDLNFDIIGSARGFTFSIRFIIIDDQLEQQLRGLDVEATVLGSKPEPHRLHVIDWPEHLVDPEPTIQQRLIESEQQQKQTLNIEPQQPDATIKVDATHYEGWDDACQVSSIPSEKTMSTLTSLETPINTITITPTKHSEPIEVARLMLKTLNLCKGNTAQQLARRMGLADIEEIVEIRLNKTNNDLIIIWRQAQTNQQPLQREKSLPTPPSGYAWQHSPCLFDYDFEYEITLNEIVNCHMYQEAEKWSLVQEESITAMTIFKDNDAKQKATSMKLFEPDKIVELQFLGSELQKVIYTRHGARNKYAEIENALPKDKRSRWSRNEERYELGGNIWRVKAWSRYKIKTDKT